jgi:hypothetical protein
MFVHTAGSLDGGLTDRSPAERGRFVSWLVVPVLGLGMVMTSAWGIFLAWRVAALSLVAAFSLGMNASTLAPGDAEPGAKPAITSQDRVCSGKESEQALSGPVEWGSDEAILHGTPVRGEDSQRFCMRRDGLACDNPGS